MKLSKNIEWLRPFIEASSSIVNLDKIKAIKGYKLPKGVEAESDGCTHNVNNKYTVTIRTHY